MPRPRKKPSDRRRHVINLRLTDAELAELKRMARDAGVPYGRYVRETVLGRRPKARPAQVLIFQKLLYELQSIATNFKQLAEATGDALYTPWARFVGGQLVEQLLGRDDLSDMIDGRLDAINVAGQQVNALARKANSEIAFKASERSGAFRILKTALEPIRLALQSGNRKLDYPTEA